MENAFRDGEIKTTGTDIDGLMPPVSRFGGGGVRTKKKQTVIDKLQAFFERFFGIGGGSFADGTASPKIVSYADIPAEQPIPMAAEENAPYGEEKGDQ